MNNFFVDKLKKPSAAVRAMIDGLIEFDQKENCEVNMKFYAAKGFVCMACAAGSAVMKATGTDYTSTKGRIGRADKLGVTWVELFEVELRLDGFRQGKQVGQAHLGELFGTVLPPYPSLPELTNRNWRKNLPEYEKYAEFLESKGL